LRNNVILLVEDNPRDEALTLRALGKCNLANEVVVARDGVEALSYLFDEPEDGVERPLPQLILLDLKLPKIDGLEVLKSVRENPRTRLLPVVVFTSSSEQEDIVNSFDLRANSYVRKPVDFEQFLEATRQVGLYWLMLNEAPPSE
jgi:CheY-like chemotaxis protein